MQCLRAPRAEQPGMETATTVRRSAFAQGEEEAKAAARSAEFNAELRNRMYRHLVLASTPPEPSDVLQTVNESVVIEGIGLNSGRIERILLMPARAEDGRYFVRVPKGTSELLPNSASDGSYLEPTSLSEEQQEGLALEELRESLMDDEDRAALAERIQREREGETQELKSSSDGPFSPSEQEQRDAEEPINAHSGSSSEPSSSLPEEDSDDNYEPTQTHNPLRGLPLREQPDEEEFEGYEEEERIYAHVNYVVHTSAGGIELGTDEVGSERNVRSVERLLAALEACGIDAVRIEVEGSGEVPFVDGACEHFIASLSQVGSAPAVSYQNRHIERLAPTPLQPLVLQGKDRESGSFIAVIPDDTRRIAVGVDMQESTNAISRQWTTHVPSQDESFFDRIAPARKLMTRADMETMQAEDGLQGGRAAGLLVCDTEKLLNPPERFHGEEVARSEMVHLYAAMALAAHSCISGVPNAHIVSFNADLGLMMHAAREVESLTASTVEFYSELQERIEQEADEKTPEEVGEEMEEKRPPGDLTQAWHPPLVGPDSK